MVHSINIFFDKHTKKKLLISIRFLFLINFFKLIYESMSKVGPICIFELAQSIMRYSFRFFLLKKPGIWYYAVQRHWNVKINGENH